MGALLAGFIVIVVVVIVLLKRDDGEAATLEPSQAPSSAPTMAPTSSALASLVRSLSPISGEDAFADKTSPQYMAVEWLAEEDTYGVSLNAADPMLLQRYALAVVYYALGGPFWRICGQGDETCTGDAEINSWLSPTSECSWYGILCGESGMVEEFYFRKLCDLG